MTNYNDGKWHGWNGGECPVHPKSEVEFVTIDNDFPHEWTASAVDWSSDVNPVVAFRVIKEHKEPREFWLFSGHVFSTFDYALTFANGKVGRIIHVREVTE